MAMSFSYARRGRSFMVMSNLGAADLIQSLGLESQFTDENALRAGDVQERIARARKHAPKEIRDNLIALDVATRHLPDDDWVFVG